MIGSIDSALSHAFTANLNECPICRDYAEKSLKSFRETGDWLGMAEAYREMALSYHQEGNSEKSVEYFDLGVKIIGERSAPFMLGKLYTRHVRRVLVFEAAAGRHRLSRKIDRVF